MIYIILDSGVSASAGKRNLYKLADVLHRKKFPVTLLQNPIPENAIYNSVAPISSSVRVFTAEDTVIIAEYQVAGTDLTEFNDAKVISWVQNPFLLFHNQFMEKKNSRIDEFWCVSAYTKQYLERLYPDKPVKFIQNYVTKDYKYTDKKEKLITYMPRKNAEVMIDILNSLLATDSLDGWTLAPIDNMTQPEVTKLLKRSAIFLSIGDKEGNPTPVLEALASGCRVVGYDGWSKELWREYMVQVDNNDILDWHIQITDAAAAFDRNPEEWFKQTKMASDFVKTIYSEPVFEKSVVEAMSGC